MRAIGLILITLLMIFSMETGAQSPSMPEPVDDALRAAMANLKAELAATRAETKALMADKLKQKNAQLERSLVREKQRQARLATLTAQRAEVQVKIKAVEIPPSENKQLEGLLKRNAELENQIKKANRTFACRVLHLGCVGKK